MEISSGVDTPAQARARLFARLRIRDQEFACESDYVQAFEAALASETQGDANAMQPEAAAELLEKELVGEFVEVVFHIAVLGGDLLLAEVLKVVSVEPDAEHGVRYHCLVPSLGQDSCIEWIGPLTELRPAAIGYMSIVDSIPKESWNIFAYRALIDTLDWKLRLEGLRSELNPIVELNNDNERRKQISDANKTLESWENAKEEHGLSAVEYLTVVGKSELRIDRRKKVGESSEGFFRSSRCLGWALQLSYRSFGFGLMALVCVVPFLGGIWPAEQLVFGFFVLACAINVVTCFYLELRSRRWGVRFKFGLAGFVQLVGLLGGLYLALNYHPAFICLGIFLYLLGCYGFLDGMREIRRLYRLKSDITSKVSVDLPYRVKRTAWVTSLIAIEHSVYVIESYVFANKLGEFHLEVGKPGNGALAETHPALKEGGIDSSVIGGAVWDFVGLMLATLALVALGYYATGHEAILEEHQRTVYVAVLSVAVAIYCVSRVMKRRHHFSLIPNIAIVLTMVFVWGYLKCETVQRDLDTWRRLRESPKLNLISDQSSLVMVERAMELIEHCPAEEESIRGQLESYLRKELAEIVSNKRKSKSELLVRLSELERAVNSCGEDFSPSLREDVAAKVQAFTQEEEQTE